MIPVLAQWEFTDRCNYRCLHCYHLDPNRGESPIDSTDDDMWKIAEIIIENKLFFITFTGGEPLMRGQLLIQIAKHLHNYGLHISLNTNLSLIDEATLESLPINAFLVSCPASDPEVYGEITGGGSFEFFAKRLKMLVESKAVLTVNMVVSKLNQHLIRPTAVHLAEIGVKKFAATPMSINAGNPNLSLLLSPDEVRSSIDDLIWVFETLGLDVDIMEAIPKCVMPRKAFDLDLPFVYRSCHAGKRNGAIANNGDVRPCGHNPQIFGNLLKDEMSVIWQRMHNWRQSTDNQHSDCIRCDVFSRCGGGCRVDAQIQGGRLNSKHPYMTLSITDPKIPEKPVLIEPETIVRRVNAFYSRPENGGWLVASCSGRTTMQVNEPLYKFLMATRQLPALSIAELAIKFGTNFSDPEFQRIMRILIRKQYFVIVH